MFVLFPFVLLGSVGLDILVTVVVLSRIPAPRPSGLARSITLPAFLSALMAVAVVFTIRVLALALFGRNVFALMSLTYVTLAISLPLIGLGLLFVCRRRRREDRGIHIVPTVRIICLLLAAPAPVAVYATFIEPFRLQLETADVTISRERRGRDAIRIGVLADVQTSHVTDFEFGAVDRLMAQRPDVILLPGDLFHATWRTLATEEPALRRLLYSLA